MGNKVIVGRGYFDQLDDEHFCLRPDAGSWAGKIRLNKRRLRTIYDKHGTLVFIPSEPKPAPEVKK